MTQHFEYQVVPAPKRSTRFKGLTRKDDAFSLTITDVMNEHAREGWEYVRADKLSETKGVWPLRRTLPERDLLVFRREMKRSLERRNDHDVEAAKIRARRVRRDDLVAMVQSGARRVEIGEPINAIAAE